MFIYLERIFSYTFYFIYLEYLIKFVLYILFSSGCYYIISNSSAGQSLWIFDSFQTTFHLLHEHFWRKQKNKKVDDCITFVFREHCNMQYVRKAKVVMQNLDEWFEVVQSVDHWLITMLIDIWFFIFIKEERWKSQVADKIMKIRRFINV